MAVANRLVARGCLVLRDVKVPLKPVGAHVIHVPVYRLPPYVSEETLVRALSPYSFLLCERLCLLRRRTSCFAALRNLNEPKTRCLLVSVPLPAVPGVAWHLRTCCQGSRDLLPGTCLAATRPSDQLASHSPLACFPAVVVPTWLPVANLPGTHKGEQAGLVDLGECQIPSSLTQGECNLVLKSHESRMETMGDSARHKGDSWRAEFMATPGVSYETPASRAERRPSATELTMSARSLPSAHDSPQLAAMEPTSQEGPSRLDQPTMEVDMLVVRLPVPKAFCTEGAAELHTRLGSHSASRCRDTLSRSTE
ncbi:hypothetical protein HPB47_015351 [Ixodes persulcatus]|uniref:Uncharacterized protein n=1 Tax=Ixodes persulcatus TaxID=34615 RepID=A0AC60QUK5_IXOPE|nr:hypothetical protein HPB47_015351 [Ixodes persulcatus]